MPQMRVIFYKCLQDSQELRSDDEYMKSRFFFSLEVGGQRYDGLYADIKQTVGTPYATRPMEVSSPKGAPYKGPFNYERFRNAAEIYYRSLMGRHGIAFPVSAGSRMRKNEVIYPRVVEFDSSGPDVSWD